MSNAAQQLPTSSESQRVYWTAVNGRSQLTSTSNKSPFVLIQSHKTTVAKEIAVLGLILATLQILDGVLTALGISIYGSEMEGNALLRSFMDLIGCLPALVVVKSISVAVIAGLCLHAYSVPWLKHALRGVIGLYVIGAVLPWTVILSTEFLG